jgi:hypothetical protein
MLGEVKRGQKRLGISAVESPGTSASWRTSTLLPSKACPRASLAASYLGLDDSSPTNTIMNTPRFMVAVAALAGALTGQSQVLCPDNHHLSEGLAKSGSSTNWWGTTITGRRFQVLYDASHFTANGVTGPISISALDFRGEDADHNKGGQTYTSVTVGVYSTSLSSGAALSTTFATNLLPATSTLLSTTLIPTVTVAPSPGTCPNSYCVNLPLGGPALPYDPMSAAQPNLLVDIVWLAYAPAPAVPPAPATPMIGTQDTTGTTAQIRGRGLFAATPAAVTGTGSTTPPVMRVTFVGPGGYAALVPARVESIGGACGGAPSAFYELHRHTQNYDLRNPGQIDGLTGLTLTPNVYPAPAFYIVTGGAAPVDLVGGVTGVADTIGDDATYPHVLPGAFDYPGGSTGTIRPSTNGYIILDPASPETSSDFSATLAEFLGSDPAKHYPRLAPCWHDFHAGRNIVSHPTAGLYARNIGTVCLVTWNVVGSFDTATADNEKHTFQVAIDTATGVVQFRYGAMDEIGGDTFDDLLAGGDYISCLTGFSRGRIGVVASVDPQSRDLSIERPFTTAVEGGTGHMGLTAVSAPAPAHYLGRMYGGQSITWSVNNIPATSIIGVQFISAGPAAQPGLQFPGVTAPGCMVSTFPNPLVHHVVVPLVPPTFAGTAAFTVPPGYNPGFLGFQIVAQFMVLDGLLGGPNFITVASNALVHTIGLQ